MRNGDTEIKLPWLSYRLLCVLCEAAPGIVDQQTLIDKVWPNAVIGDETLKQRVKLLRRALNDNANAPQYIEAIRGRGYRILPHIDVQVIGENAYATSMDLSTDSHAPTLAQGQYPYYWRVTSGVLFAVLMLVIVVALLVDAGPKRALPNTNITALTFADELTAKGLEYYHRYRKDDNRHAIELFQSAIELEPQQAITYAALSDAYSQGVFQFDGPAQWQQLAIDTAYKAIALNPNLAQGYKALGLAYYNKGWLTQAINANLKAVQKQPNYNEAMSNLGYIYREMGQLSQSLLWADKALAAQPNNSVSMVHKALTLTAMMQYKEAHALLHKALLLQPDSLLANDALGQWYLAQGLFVKSQQHYRELMVLEPEQPLYQLGLARSYLYQGELAQVRLLAQPLTTTANIAIKHQAQLLAVLASPQVDTKHSAQLKQLLLDALAQGSDKPSDSWALAQLFAFEGDSAACQRYLVQAINQGWLNITLTLSQPNLAALIANEASHAKGHSPNSHGKLQQLIDEMRVQVQHQSPR